MPCPDHSPTPSDGRDKPLAPPPLVFSYTRAQAVADRIAEDIAMMAAAQAQGKATIDANGLIQRLMMRCGRDSRFVENTLAKMSGVHRLISLYQMMPRFSDTRLKSTASKEPHESGHQSLGRQSAPSGTRGQSAKLPAWACQN